MTVLTTNNRSGPFYGKGVTTTFPYNFRIHDQTHLRVVKNVAGVETVAVLATEYSVTGVGNDSGGSVVFVTAPVAGVTIYLVRKVPNALILSEVIAAYPSGQIAEKAAIKTTNAFLKPFQDMWTDKGSSLVHMTCINSLFLGAISIAHSIGVPINGFMATTAIGAITAGKPLTEVLRAFKGGAHSAKPDDIPPRSS